MSKEIKRCSFCGRELKENEGFYGIYGNICKYCVDNINNIIEESKFSSPSIKLDSIPKPTKIKEFLDKYIIGQDKAKRIISTAVYNHYKRINNSESCSDVEIGKTGILMVGPTGSGKTEIARTVAKMIDVPFTVVDSTTFTESGYVGEDVESIISRLYQAANEDVERTERGIVFLDEIDKIAKRTANGSITKEVRGEGVQQALLKLLEDSIINIPPKGGRKHPDQPYIQINTKNILFIASGAFVGLEDRIKSRISEKRSIGFNAITLKELDENELLQHVDVKDIKNYGFIPELIGRLPVVTYVEKLNKEQLVKILKEPKNALIKQYKKLFELDGIELSFTEEVYDYVAEEAVKNDLGARGLRGIMEKIMEIPMFEMPGSNKKKIKIDKKWLIKHNFIKEEKE